MVFFFSLSPGPSPKLKHLLKTFLCVFWFSVTVSCSTEGQLGQKVKPNSVSVNADNIVIHNNLTKVVMVHTLQCETPSEQNDID